MNDIAIDSELKDKVCLITGSSSGIGAAVAIEFGKRGAKVAVHYASNRENADKVVSAIRELGGCAEAFMSDLCRPGQATSLVQAVIEAFGTLDILINNAGGPLLRKNVEDIADDEKMDVVHLNLLSVVEACQAAVRHFKKTGSGNIINTVSQAAKTGGGPGATLYAMSKGGVNIFSKGLARELAPLDIRVNTIAPGFTATKMYDEKVAEKLVQGIPMGRIGTPGDLVGAFLFFSKPSMSGFITGHSLDVNGGHSM